MAAKKKPTADPFCTCGYRKSLHPDGLPSDGGCKSMQGGFRESVTFNEALMTTGRTPDTEMAP